MIAWVGFVVTFPLVFVAERRRYLPPIALAAIAAMIPLGLALRSLWGMPGIAVALGLATAVAALGLLFAVDRRTFAIAVVGLARVALALGAASALAFGALSLAVPDVVAAVLGVAVYALIVLSTRSFGLSEGWAYVRGLH
jgi:hypothetical protein